MVMSHARATRSPTERDGEDSDSQSLLTKLFSLPGGRAAVFFLHEFDNPNLVGRIDEYGGRVTDEEAAADVILTRSREEYRSLKDRYAVSKNTHVRMSGFIDRCIDAQRFVLAPIPGKGLPGRVPGARRNEFTLDDDEQLCQYIADVLPDKEDGGRTGHFIYNDLMRRADQYGQYEWAQRHTKSSWRERYRKHQGRLDVRIAEIVHENPPAPDGKGQYRFRRRGKFEEDEEDFALDAEAEVEEYDKSPTDNDDDPVLAKNAGGQPQKEEEEEDELEEQPDDEFDPRDQDFHREEEEEGEEAARQPSPSPAPPTQRIGRSSQGKPPAPKRRKAAASQGREEEVRDPNDPDQTLLDDDDIPPEDEDDAPATPEPQMRTRATRQTPRAAQPVSPRRTRASTRLRTVNPPEHTMSPARRRAKATTTSPTTRRSRMRARTRSVSADATVAKAKSGAATSLDPVAESANDEFQAHSEDEGDMDEVEGTLGEDGDSRARRYSLSPDDRQTHKRLRRARAVHDEDADEDEDEEDELEDESDAELLAQVRRLETRPPPTPARASHRQSKRVEDSEEEEVLPSPGTRAQAERSRRTHMQKVNVAPPSQGTRAAAKGKARETALRLRPR